MLFKFTISNFHVYTSIHVLYIVCSVRQRRHVCVRSHKADRFVRRDKIGSGQLSGALRAVRDASFQQCPLCPNPKSIQQVADDTICSRRWVVHLIESCCVKKATKAEAAAARGHVDVRVEEQHALLLEDYLADEYTWDAFFSEYLEQGTCCPEPDVQYSVAEYEGIASVAGNILFHSKRYLVLIALIFYVGQS